MFNIDELQKESHKKLGIYYEVREKMSEWQAIWESVEALHETPEWEEHLKTGDESILEGLPAHENYLEKRRIFDEKVMHLKEWKEYERANKKLEQASLPLSFS